MVKYSGLCHGCLSQKDQWDANLLIPTIIGGPDTVYYVTVYGSKNTQADDVEQQQAISI